MFLKSRGAKRVIDKRLLIIAFIVIAILASMDARPRTIVLSIAMSEDSPSPLNTGDLGSSIFASKLEERGFNVVIVPSPLDLSLALSKYDKAVIVILGSEYLSVKTVRETVKAIKASSGNLSWIGFLLADEAPSQAFNTMLEESQNVVCGEKVLSIGKTYLAPRTIIKLMLPSGTYTLLTGYTAPVYFTSLASPGFAIVAPENPTPLSNPPSPEVEAWMVGYAWPSTEPPRGLWYPIAGYCESSRGRVVVVGDTTMFINMTLSESPEALEAALGLTELAAGGKDAAIIFVQEHYVGEEALASIAFKILPSVVLTYIASLYSSAEDTVMKTIASSGPLAAAFAASLAFIAWALMPLPYSGERVKGTGASGKFRVRVWVLRLGKRLKRAR